MIKRKKKRKKRVSRYKGIGISTNPNAPAETPEMMRKKFPEKLIQAFVNVVVSNWDDKMYKKYTKQAKAFLGEKFEDKIDSGRLVVRLSRASSDLIDEIKKKRKKLPKKLTCEEHPKYKAMRTPRSGCEKCWTMYNGKKTVKKTTKKKAT